jgi:sugar porter (SP) family MFS transporter
LLIDSSAGGNPSKRCGGSIIAAGSQPPNDKTQNKNIGEEIYERIIEISFMEVSTMTGARKGTLIAAVGTAALGGFLFGFDTAVIAGTTADLTRVYSLTPSWLGFTVSAALWGTLIGALFAGKPGDKFGSRDSLKFLAFLYLVTGLGCALAWSWESFVALRFLCGLAVGGSSVLAPVYISELAPPQRRGFLVGTFQFNVIFGILIAYVSNGIVAHFELGEIAWRWKLGIVSVPAGIFMLLLYTIPNSPRWLLAKGRDREAENSLQRLGRMPAAAHNEMEELRAALAHAPHEERLSWKRHRTPILLAFTVAVFNQLTGINAILYYLNDIFARGGSLSPDLQAISIGVANLIFTGLGVVLIDRVGRRTLLMVGGAGMSVCLAVSGLALFGILPESVLLWSLMGFILFFAPGQGAVIWVYISEVFPTSVRSRGSSLGASTHWGMAAIIALIFPTIAAWSAGAPFLFFALAMVLQVIVVGVFFPETKGVSLEDMSARLGAA